MDACANNYRLNDLPQDLLHDIFKFLPMKEKMIVVPRVCTLFFKAATINPHNFYSEFARNALKQEISECQYSESQINFIISLVKSNNFISILREKTFKFDFKSASFLRYRTQLIVHHDEPIGLISHAKYEDYRLVSNDFQLSWNPDKPIFLTTAKQKLNYMRSSFLVEILVDKFMIAKNRFNLFETETINNFSITGESFGPIEQAGFFTWGKCKRVQPINMQTFIKHALSLQLKLFTAYFTHLNLLTLSLIEKEEFEKEDFRKSYYCDINGRIESGSDRKFLFTIKKRRIEQGLFILFWESNDYTNDESLCNASHFLRWAVYSSTTDQIAKIHGIKIEHFKLNC